MDNRSSRPSFRSSAQGSRSLSDNGPHRIFGDWQDNGHNNRSARNQHEENNSIDEVNRAIQAVGLENFFKNKRRIIKLIAKLGGEDDQVSYQRLFDGYADDNQCFLDNEKCKQLFGIKSILKCLQELFADELDVKVDLKRQGQFYVQLKESYDETLQRLKKQKEDFARKRLDSDSDDDQSSRRFMGRVPEGRQFKPYHHSKPDSPVEKAIVRRERDLKPSRFDSPTPEPTSELPPRKVPEVRKHLSLKGVGGIEDNRYKGMVSRGPTGYAKLEKNYVKPKTPNQLAYSQRGYGEYTDDESVLSFSKKDEPKAPFSKPNTSACLVDEDSDDGSIFYRELEKKSSIQITDAKTWLKKKMPEQEIKPLRFQINDRSPSVNFFSENEEEDVFNNIVKEFDPSDSEAHVESGKVSSPGSAESLSPSSFLRENRQTYVAQGSESINSDWNSMVDVTLSWLKCRLNKLDSKKQDEVLKGFCKVVDEAEDQL